MSKKTKSSGGPPPPIYSMAHEQQVDLLAQALLREYMHRKKYSGTLQTFDEENPRDEKTVSSRAVMGDLMHLPADKIQGMKERSLDTFMEMLCADRIDKRERLSVLAEMKSVLESEMPDFSVEENGDAGSGDDGETQEGGKKKKEKKAKKEKKEKKGKGKMPSDETSDSKKKKKKHMSLDELLDTEVPASASPPSATVSTDENLSSRSADVTTTTRAPVTTSIRKAPPEATLGANTVGNGKPSRKKDDDSEGSHSDSSSGSDSEEEEEPARRDDTTPPRKKMGWGGDLDSAPGAALTEQKMDSFAAVAQLNSSSGFSPDAKPSPSKILPPVPSASDYAPECLGLDMAKRLKLLFVGGDRRIPESFVRQGFHFSTKVTYGLVQNEGGPCGLLSVVQGFLIAELLNRAFIVTREALPSALSTAIARSLCIVARVANGPVVVALPATDAVELTPESAKSVPHQHHFIASMTKTEVMSPDVSEVEKLVSTVFDSWSIPHGVGLLAFMTSLVLTRGITAVSRDMDVEAPLIVEHGYCSQELTSLA